MIVNVIGMAGEKPSYEYICGAVANAGLAAFTKGLGGKSPEFGVRVVAVHPPATRTDRIMTLVRNVAKQKYGDESRADEVLARRQLRPRDRARAGRRHGGVPRFGPGGTPLRRGPEPRVVDARRAPTALRDPRALPSHPALACARTEEVSQPFEHWFDLANLVEWIWTLGRVPFQCPRRPPSTHQRHRRPRTRRPEAAGRIRTWAPEGGPAAVGTHR